MKYAKITNGVVAQVQPYTETGFVGVPDYVVCGMVDNGDGTFSNPVAPLADRQERKWEEIKSYRDKVKAGGVLVSTKWFHTDDASRIQQLGLVQLGANLPAGIMWKTMDGTFIEMTQQLASDIFSAVTQLDIDAFANAETHRAAMEASADPENYDYSNGWPNTYLY